jgi:hypothetical protein
MMQVAKATTRGVVAAMAMSGLRQLTTSLDLVEQVPPESVLRKTAPQMFYRVPVERRAALVEAIHWSYGSLGGGLFGLLPRQLRRHPWTGPLYGLAFWGIFQAVIRPALGLDSGHRQPRQRLALLADHTLYGAVVAASPFPYRD